jgi:hypothetical protein
MSVEAGPNAVTAIDILLEPDATMLQRAQADDGVTHGSTHATAVVGRHCSSMSESSHS